MMAVGGRLGEKRRARGECAMVLSGGPDDGCCEQVGGVRVDVVVLQDDVGAGAVVGAVGGRCLLLWMDDAVELQI